MNQKAAQKQKSHDAIVASAAALLRERGIRASSVMDVMKGAGLTVGGFYNHFASKEDLFANAIGSSASATWNRLLALATGDSPRERARSLIGRYLSRSHRDNPNQGCVLPGAAAEVAREGEPYRSALSRELDAFIDQFAQLVSGTRPRELALGVFALLYGALSLSRVLAGTPMSDEVLAAAKQLADRMLDVPAPTGAHRVPSTPRATSPGAPAKSPKRSRA
jgi:TetR/AcrR family transcriptional repressor of nem operon